MKKLVIFMAVLFVSVVCTACINNFAVQELNNKAKQYMDGGDVQNAICRLESSVDLDGSIFESRYNLGVAYIAKENFKSAQTQLKAAIKLNPQSADAYYSLAVAQEGEGNQALTKNQTSDGNIQAQDQTTEQASQTNKEPARDDAVLAVSRFDDAIKSYNKYLELNPEAKDKEQVQKQIEELTKLINENTSKFDLNTPLEEENN